MPVDAFQELPYPVVWWTPAPSGLQTKPLASAAAATVPPPVTPDGSEPWNQLAPLSVEKPMCGAASALPTRTTVFGPASAKSRLVVDVRLGEVNIMPGTASRSVCRKPPMSPSALSSGAPDGGLARSLTAVSSSPFTIGVILNLLPESQLVRFSVP